MHQQFGNGQFQACVMCQLVIYCRCNLQAPSLNLPTVLALTLLIASFDQEKPVPNMTYNVSGGTLNLTQLELVMNSQNIL